MLTTEQRIQISVTRMNAESRFHYGNVRTKSFTEIAPQPEAEPVVERIAPQKKQTTTIVRGYVGQPRRKRYEYIVVAAANYTTRRVFKSENAAKRYQHQLSATYTLVRISAKLV